VRQPVDLASKQFGLLVALHKVVEGGRSKWLCQCRCGKQKSVRQGDLLNGRTRSCGCARLRLKQAKAEKKYSLVNQRFGRLHVLWKSKSKKSGRSMIWDCQCDCGKIVPVTGTNLRTGKTKHCGCLQEVAQILDRYVDSILSFEEFVAACERVVNPLKRK
jgi:hypothetical protein